MAGVYIKNMEMPEKCEDCRFWDGQNNGCPIVHMITLRRTYQKKPDWCPLVEVPDHGDLIDANTMIGVELYDECREEWYERAMTIWEYLGYASTINVQTVIPAERSYECD